MKKLTVLLLTLALVFALAACGGGSKGPASTYNLDMKSTELQAMSEERASVEVLRETRDDYFQGLNYFTGTDLVKLTYADVVEHIGVDPSAYQYDDVYEREIYFWYPEGKDENTYFVVWFLDGKLDASGSVNL